jgi:MFS transporter, ACDE family, multidrug resistance protein
MSHGEAVHHGQAKPSLFRQPRAVWAVAFACVISFMGIGLVDPILPALSKQLDATPAQVSLLFTSYLVVTAVAMLVTNWVSSRIGAKRTLMAGLVLIVVFAALAGTAGSISGIVGFRAGWGLGNALFIATSLAVIVASASGGFEGAIILYETALGLGIAVGPLLGGFLGNVSWRGPFFGVSALMAIAFIATTVFVPPTPKPAQKTSLAAPLKALRHRGLLIMSLTALCYNWGFFTLLGYAPYPMKLGPIQLGLVFTGWGILVALFSVSVAPRLHRRFGTAPTLYVNLVMLAIVLAVIGFGTGSPDTVIVATIVSGAFIGINNTLTTQAVMMVSPVERPVAAASYGFVRFIGGGLAPYVAGKIAESYNIHVPFLLGAVAMLLAIAVLSTGHRLLANAERASRAGVAAVPDDEAAADDRSTAGDAAGDPSDELITIGQAAVGDRRPIVLAIDAGPAAASATAKVIEIAKVRHSRVDVLHVQEVEVVVDAAIDRESLDQARAFVEARLAELRAADVEATGHVLRSIADHANIGRLIAEYAGRMDAKVIVIGEPTTGAFARLLDRSSSQHLLADAPCDVLVVGIEREPELLTPA